MVKRNPNAGKLPAAGVLVNPLLSWRSLRADRDVAAALGPHLNTVRRRFQGEVIDPAPEPEPAPPAKRSWDLRAPGSDGTIQLERTRGARPEQAGQTGKRTMASTDLSALLEAALAFDRWEADGSRLTLLRPYPSHRDAHPVEAYVVARSVRGIPRGAYHYRPEDHLLERALGPTDPATWRNLGPRGAPLLVALVADWDAAFLASGRRGYRHALLEAGTMLERLRAAARDAGFATDEIDPVEGDWDACLGVAGLRQGTIAALAVGGPPPRPGAKPRSALAKWRPT